MPKISQLTTSTSVSRSDFVIVNVAGVTDKATVAELLSLAASSDITTALGFTPMRGSSNLSELTDSSTARTNLSLGSAAIYNVNAFPAITATSFTGDGSGLTGIGTGTGGVINTGSTTIGADSDADGVGIISLQTRGVERVAIDNLGLIGIGTNSPSGTIDVNTMPAAGSDSVARVFRLRTNEVGSGDYSINYNTSAGQNGETRGDNQLTFGYNPSGPGYVSGEPTWAFSFEPRYKTGEGQLQSEFYFIADDGAGHPSRPFGITMSHNFAPGAVTVSLGAANVGIGFDDTADAWLFFTSTDNAGDATFHRDSGITFSADNTREWIIKHAGNSLLGIGSTPGSGSGVEFAASYGELNLFGTSIATDQDYYLTMGNGGGFTGFKWNHTSQRMEVANAYGNSGTPPTYSPINGELGVNQNHYAVTRTLGTTAGDYVEIGTLIGGDGGSLFEIWATDSGMVSKHYVVPTTYGFASSSWLELLPESGDFYNSTMDWTIDYQHSTGKLRLRRTGSDGYSTVSVTVKRYGPSNDNNKFTATSASGSGATASGIFGPTPFGVIRGKVAVGTNTPLELFDVANKFTVADDGTIKVWDGASLNAVSIGAADSGGSGYRLLRIPN